MRVTVDLDPKDVWRIQERAERLGVTPGEVLRVELASKRSHENRHARIRAGVEAGLTDREIADEMGEGVTAIRDVRQKNLRMPANRRRRQNNEETRTA